MTILTLFDEIELVFSQGRWTSQDAAWAKLFNDKTELIRDDMIGYHVNTELAIVNRLLEDMPYAKLTYQDKPQKVPDDENLIY